jgi:Fungal protein kinase
MMNDEELGLDTFTSLDTEHRSITITEDATGKERRLWLEPDLIAYQRAIVCRGTSCFRAGVSGAEEPRYVVKFSWTSDKRPPEADLLRLARERGVKGVAKLFGHHRITSIATMREGLTFINAHTFRTTTFSPSSSFSQSQPQSLLRQSFSQLHGLSIAEDSPRKRKSMDAGGRPSKRSRSNSQRSDKNQQEDNEVVYPVEEKRTTSLYAHDKNSFDNRIFCCLVISPPGRGLRDFRSIPQLLEAFRDAIKAHRSLLMDGKILHRDISENNTIITDPRKADGFAGTLIDLDLAKELGSGPSGARHRTGTMQFMAIEVLLGISHTYRHDLESFFYVLLWLCARHGWDFVQNPKGRPQGSMFTGWYTGSYKEIANKKLGNMDKGKGKGLEVIMEEFPPLFDCVKALCKVIRDVLFPYRDGLFTGTPKDAEVLYGPITEAFDNTIGDIVARGL